MLTPKTVEPSRLFPIQPSLLQALCAICQCYRTMAMGAACVGGAVQIPEDLTEGGDELTSGKVHHPRLVSFMTEEAVTKV